MALRTSVEVALHFESFRNVDLFHQGLYHLKTRLYRDDGEQRMLAVPYGHITCPVQLEEPKPKPSRTDHHHLIPAHIIEDQCTFSTRSFLIRYCEEEVELNDIGQFRIELDSEEFADNSMPFLLEVDLMFADLTQHGGADRFGEQPDVDSTEFKSVSTQTFRIRSVENGLHEFCPIVFDEFHFCLANLVIHSILFDYRLRLRPLLSARQRPSKGKGPGEGGAAVQTPSVPSTQNAALSLAECLFGGCRAEGRERLLILAERLYERHCGSLCTSYNQLALWFKRVTTKCLTPAQREVFGDAVEILPLELPDCWSPASSTSGGKGDVTNGQHGTLQKQAFLAKLGPDANEQALAMRLAFDMSALSCQIMEVWHKALNVMSFAYREVSTLLRSSWERAIVDRWGESIMKETVTGDITTPEDKAIWEAHNKLSDNLRLSAQYRNGVMIAVEDMSLMPKMELHPILFEQRYVARGLLGRPGGGVGGGQRQALPLHQDDSIPSAPKHYRGVHLFVLVHGFQGNSFDMRLMKNNIALLYPDAIFLCSNSNEDNTEGDLNEMGIRLAQEVVNYICDWCPGSALGRLSFVAHSIGGLIVRAALPLLHEYASKMFTLLTFSTPHLGYFQNNISLFHTGFWVLKKWRKSTCLEQLSMSDHSDPKETFLYKLSKTKGLEYFQGIVLVSSYQDQYAPFESARVEISHTWAQQPGQDTYSLMVKSLLEPVQPERVFRFDVNFKIPEKNLDAFIGRAAHIQFLECQPIMKMIIHHCSFLFR